MNVDQVLKRMSTALQVDSPEELASVLDKRIETFRVWRTRKAIPPTVVAHVSELSGRSVSWLMETDDDSGADTAEEPRALFFGAKKKQVNQSSDADEFFFVPEVDVRASAGSGENVDSEEIIGKFAFRRSWLRQKGVRPDELAVVRASGDSMVPTVRDGDILLVDRAEGAQRADGIYLIERQNSLQCKRLQFGWGDGVIIKSDNPSYGEMKLSGKQAAANMRVVGRVIWVGGER